LRIRHDVGMPAWAWAITSLVAAGLVWLDAHRLGMTYGGPDGRDGSLGGPGWALVTLMVPIPAVPIYIWRRRRWLPTRQSTPPS
jgi:hypothetical protein